MVIHIGNNSRFPRGSGIKNLPATQEMQVPSLGYEDPPEKAIAAHSKEREKGCS